MSCNNLIVTCIDDSLTLMPAGEIHGHVEAAAPNQIVYGNTGSYGPDARVSIFKGKTPAALIEVQQNFCFLEAGKIAVRCLQGKVNMSTTEGSYADGRGGQVYVNGLG